MAKNDWTTRGICIGEEEKSPPTKTSGRGMSSSVSPALAGSNQRELPSFSSTAASLLYDRTSYQHHTTKQSKQHSSTTMASESGQSREAAAASPRRSKPIAIAPKSRSKYPHDLYSGEDHDFLDTEAQYCYAVECELCTWRMYHRIASYRQKYPVVTSSHYDDGGALLETSSSPHSMISSHTTTKPAPPGTVSAAAQREDDHPQLLLEEDEQEVFEIEDI